MLVLLAGCGGGGGGGGQPDNTNLVVSIGLLPTTMTLNVGLSKRVMATGYDSSQNTLGYVTFTWASSDTAVVTVDTNGNVTGQAAGTATVTASANGITSNAVTITVAPPADLHPLAISPYALPPAIAGTAYSTTLVGSGGDSPYSWGGAAMPPDGSTNGLTLTAYNGVLSGTPVLGGLMPIALRMSDTYNYIGYINTELNITPGVTSMAITNAPLDGTQGAAYNFNFTTTWTGQTGCAANMKFHGGVIPPGLTFDAFNGTLSGTPLVAGEFTFSASAGTGSFCAPNASIRYTDIDTYTINILPGTNSAPPGVSNWQRQSTSPVLAPSTSGWDNFSLASPSVIKVGSTYMMYYGGEDQTTHLRQIGLATSTDGLTWTRNPNPVLTPGAPGSFDSLEVQYPSVVYDGSTYHMWYMGTNQSCNYIGAATSSDGVTWTKHSGSIDLGNCNTFGQNYAPGPVIYNNGTFTMWYWAPERVNIGTATSSDGITWTDNGLVSFDSAFATNITIDRPSIVQDGGTYRMWFGMTNSITNSTGSNIYRTNIGYATSTDGVNWTGYDDTGSGGTFAIFSIGTAGAWDRPGVGQPSVMLDNGTYRMWYSGGRINSPIPGYFSYVEGSIGYAVIQ